MQVVPVKSRPFYLVTLRDLNRRPVARSVLQRVTLNMSRSMPLPKSHLKLQSKRKATASQKPKVNAESGTSTRSTRGARQKPPEGARSPCPVACTLDIIGDRWTLLIIRDLLCGKSHFKEFRDSPERVATNILAQRLMRLMESGLIERFPSEVFPGREAYRLTEEGLSLRPLLEQMAAWGLEHIPGTSARFTPRTAA